jgi:hypothetical protein
MKESLRCLLAGLALILAAGCSTLESRIRSQQAAFDAWPPAVQEKIRAGQIDLGFTLAMVQVALGDADRTYTRATDRGTSEVWVYFDHSPKISVGVGVGSSSGSTAYGGSMVVGNEGFRDNEVLRVIFEGGKVVAVESRRK